jgi:hypothetical protein
MQLKTEGKVIEWAKIKSIYLILPY